MKIKTNFKFFT